MWGNGWHRVMADARQRAHELLVFVTRRDPLAGGFLMTIRWCRDARACYESLRRPDVLVLIASDGGYFFL